MGQVGNGSEKDSSCVLERKGHVNSEVSQKQITYITWRVTNLSLYPTLGKTVGNFFDSKPESMHTPNLHVLQA